jgi:hypothetical protein
MRVEQNQRPLITKVTVVFFVFFSLPVLQIGLMELLAEWNFKGILEISGIVILAYYAFLWISVIAFLWSKRWAWYLAVGGNALFLTVMNFFCSVEAILFGGSLITLALIDIILWIWKKRT